MDVKALLLVVIQISMMLVVASIGLQSRWSDLAYAFTRPGLLFRGFIAVYVVVPIVAIVSATLLPLEPIVKVGIVAMAVSPLAPFAPGKMLKAGADTSFVVGVYVDLIVLAVIVLPLTLWLLTTLFPNAVVVGSGPIAWLILKSILLPLAAGLVIAQLVPSIAPKLSRILSLIAYVALLIALIPILYAGRHLLADTVGNGTLVAIVITTLAGLAAGHLLGNDPHHKVALAQAAATRHPGIAALILHNNVDDRRALVAVIMFLLVSIVVSALYAKWAHKRLPPMPDRKAPGAAT